MEERSRGAPSGAAAILREHPPQRDLDACLDALIDARRTGGGLAGALAALCAGHIPAGRMDAAALSLLVPLPDLVGMLPLSELERIKASLEGAISRTPSRGMQALASRVRAYCEVALLERDRLVSAALAAILHQSLDLRAPPLQPSPATRRQLEAAGAFDDGGLSELRRTLATRAPLTFEVLRESLELVEDAQRST